MATGPGEPGGQRQGPVQGSWGSSGICSVPSGAERCPSRGAVCARPQKRQGRGCGPWAGGAACPGSAPPVPCRCSVTRRGSSASAPRHRHPGTAAGPGPRQPRAARAREGLPEVPVPCVPQQTLQPHCVQQEGHKAPARLRESTALSTCEMRPQNPDMCLRRDPSTLHTLGEIPNPLHASHRIPNPLHDLKWTPVPSMPQRKPKISLGVSQGTPAPRAP